MRIFLLISIACLITPTAIGDDLKAEESLLFLTDSQSEYAVLEPQSEVSLGDLTLCLRFNTELRTRHTLFSYKSDVLLLAREDQRNFAVSLGGKEQRFQLPADLWGWVHVCTIYNASARLVGLYVNGKPTVRKLLQGSAAIAPGGAIILGHREDRIGQEPSYVGETVDVNLWDRVLAPRTIYLQMWDVSDTQGNVTSWFNARIQTKGSVVTQKSTRFQ
ncbi:LOW QUALITY PROTEIN: jeltraxin-like [Cetorhinus maximus]